MKMDQEEEEEEEMQEKEVVKHNQKNIHHVKMMMLQQQQQQSNCNVAVSSSWDESLGFGTSGDDFEEEEEEEEEVSCSESSGPPAVPASSENSCSVSNEEVVDYCYGPALKRNVRAWWVTQSFHSHRIVDFLFSSLHSNWKELLET